MSRTEITLKQLMAELQKKSNVSRRIKQDLLHFFVCFAFTVGSRTFRRRDSSAKFKDESFLPFVYTDKGFAEYEEKVPNSVEDKPELHAYRVETLLGAVPCFGAETNARALGRFQSLLGYGYFERVSPEEVTRNVEYRVNPDCLALVQRLDENPNMVQSFSQWYKAHKKQHPRSRLFDDAENMRRYAELRKIVGTEMFTAHQTSNNSGFPFIRVSDNTRFIIPDGVDEFLGYTDGQAESASRKAYSFVVEGCYKYGLLQQTDDRFSFRAFRAAIPAPTEQEIADICGFPYESEDDAQPQNGVSEDHMANNAYDEDFDDLDHDDRVEAFLQSPYVSAERKEAFREAQRIEQEARRRQTELLNEADEMIERQSLLQQVENMSIEQLRALIEGT